MRFSIIHFLYKVVFIIIILGQNCCSFSEKKINSTSSNLSLKNKYDSIKVNNDSNSLSFDSQSSSFLFPKVKNDTIIYLTYKNHKYETVIKAIEDSSTYRGTILALHGWNLPHLDWCDKTTLCEKAKALGYVVVLPHMGKSTYSERYYPETRKDWAIFPTRKWFNDTLISHLHTKFNLFDVSQKNYVLGLSTGGKGAALLALDNPEVFSAAGVLSADFDHSHFKTYNYYIGFYGNFNSFKDRWIKDDNLIYDIKKYRVPTYLGHGLKDKVSPAEQTVMFYDSLKIYQPDLKCILHIDSIAKHDYPYWNSEVDAMLSFFENF